MLLEVRKFAVVLVDWVSRKCGHRARNRCSRCREPVVLVGTEATEWMVMMDGDSRDAVVLLLWWPLLPYQLRDLSLEGMD